MVCFVSVLASALPTQVMRQKEEEAKAKARMQQEQRGKTGWGEGGGGCVGCRVLLVGWCFEPSQSQGTASGLGKKVAPLSTYSAQESVIKLQNSSKTTK